MQLWIGNTNRKDFLEECRNFQVYGTDDKFKSRYSKMMVGDYLLIKVKVNTKNNNYAYLGPYSITDRPHNWANIEINNTPWFKLKLTEGPSWLKRFPWCIFFVPAPMYINSLRVLKNQDDIRSLIVKGNKIEEVLNNLAQDEYLPTSNNKAYRTNRGVWVKSRAEYMIDNWFSSNNIVTYYERPIHLGNKMFYPDWYIPLIKTYIEFLGMIGNPNYSKKWSNKKRTYDEHKLKYVTLNENDLENLDIAIVKKIPELKNILT